MPTGGVINPTVNAYCELLKHRIGNGRSAMATSRTSDQGIYCYVMTPFEKNGDVDLGALRAYVETIIQSGVDGLTCIASTCEGPYLSEQERFDVADAVCKIAGGRVRVNVGAGATSTRQAIRYAKHAESCGATALMVDMQTYFPVTM